MGNVSFYRSAWPDIRGNAAMFTGFLLGNLPKDKHGTITKEHVCGGEFLLQLHSNICLSSQDQMQCLQIPQYYS